MNKISDRDIEALVELFDRSDWRELRVVGEGIDLFLSKDPKARRPETAYARGPAPAVSETLPPAGEPIAAPGAIAVVASKPASEVPANWVAIRAPCLGTFYRTPKPGAPPFVSIDQRVAPDMEICLIEVMKLFTTVRAGVTGIVRQVLVADAELVEFQQPLFYIEADA
jgi:acetyl-CoA carboxylase biotin carboxyl carrier protein